MTNTVKRFALEMFHFRRQRLLQNETALPVAQLSLSYKLFNFSRYRLITKPICLLRATPYHRSDFITDKVSCQRTRSCPGRCSCTRGSYLNRGIISKITHLILKSPRVLERYYTEVKMLDVSNISLGFLFTVEINCTSHNL